MKSKKELKIIYNKVDLNGQIINSKKIIKIKNVLNFDLILKYKKSTFKKNNSKLYTSFLLKNVFVWHWTLKDVSKNI